LRQRAALWIFKARRSNEAGLVEAGAPKEGSALYALCVQWQILPRRAGHFDPDNSD